MLTNRREQAIRKAEADVVLDEMWLKHFGDLENSCCVSISDQMQLHYNHTYLCRQYEHCEGNEMLLSQRDATDL